MTQYSVDYSGDEPVQTVSPSPPANDNEQRQGGYEYRPSRGFRVPNILKTAVVFMSGATLLFGLEMHAPPGFRPSTFMGTYDARIAAAVKAAELQQQSRFDAWAVQLKLAADQRAEQYKTVAQGVLANYNATYDQAKIYAEATTQMQGRLAASIIAQKQGEHGADIGIINLARMWGQLGGLIDENSAEMALQYADNRSAELSAELIKAAQIGAQADITGWNVNIASPQDVAATLATIKPLEIPPLPSLGERTVTIGGTLEARR